MNCNECSKLMTDLLAGELSSEAKQELMEHLGSCEACKREFEELESLWAFTGKTLKSARFVDELAPENRRAIFAVANNPAAEPERKPRKLSSFILWFGEFRAGSFVNVAVVLGIMVVAAAAWLPSLRDASRNGREAAVDGKPGQASSAGAVGRKDAFQQESGKESEPRFSPSPKAVAESVAADKLQIALDLNHAPGGAASSPAPALAPSAPMSAPLTAAKAKSSIKADMSSELKKSSESMESRRRKAEFADADAKAHVPSSAATTTEQELPLGQARNEGMSQSAHYANLKDNSAKPSGSGSLFEISAKGSSAPKADIAKNVIPSDRAIAVAMVEPAEMSNASSVPASDSVAMSNAVPASTPARQEEKAFAAGAAADSPVAMKAHSFKRKAYQLDMSLWKLKTVEDAVKLLKERGVELQAHQLRIQRVGSNSFLIVSGSSELILKMDSVLAEMRRVEAERMKGN